MYNFKNETNLEGMYFIKAKVDDQIVRMFACANLSECVKKVKEYKMEGFIVSWKFSPLRALN